MNGISSIANYMYVGPAKQMLWNRISDTTCLSYVVSFTKYVES
jgi:hypothetical protein